MYKLVGITLLTLGFAGHSAAVQTHSNIESIAVNNMASSGNGTLSGCDFAQAVMWGGVNEILGALVPGAAIFAKLGLAMSKIGNNVACRKLDGTQASTLAVMGEIADAKVNQALREQLTNEADDLLAQMADLSHEVSHYDQLSEVEKTVLYGKLDNLGSRASQLEAGGKSLHKEALRPVALVSAIKIAAYKAEYSILPGGASKPSLANKIAAESNETVNTIEGFEKKVADYLNGGYEYTYSAEDNQVFAFHRERTVDAKITLYGKLLWSGHYQCNYHVSNTSQCSSWHTEKESIKKQYDYEVVNQRVRLLNGFAGLDVSQTKVQAVVLANSLVATPFHNRPVTLKTSHGHCLNSLGNYGNSGRLNVSPCARNAGQKWILDSAGHLRSAERSNFCLMAPSASPVNNQRLTLQQCDTNMPFRQAFSFNESDGTLRLARVPDFCVTALGDGVVIYKCDELAAKDKLEWYKFDNLVNRASGKCLTTENGTLGLGFETCIQDATDQLWAFDRHGNIRSFGNPSPSMCLRKSSTPMGLGTCESSNSWFSNFQRVDKKVDMEVQTMDTYCLDASTDTSGWQGVAACSGTAAQLWY